MEKLNRFFDNVWAVEPTAFTSAMALLAPAIASGNLTEASKLLNAPAVMAGTISAPYFAQAWEATDTNLPEGSVMIYRLSGMLYSWHTDWLIQSLQQAEANPRIVGVILMIDGPGGHVTRVDVCARLIRDFSKPVATVVTGSMCSAHLWLGTAGHRVFAESDLCQIGSIGTMAEYSSWREYFKLNGIDVRQIYPDTSDLKNEETRAIEESGDESLTKQRLEAIHALFAQTVAENMGIKYDPSAELFRGKVYSSAQAVKAGLVHEMGGVAQAARWVLANATSREVAKLYN